MRYLDQSDFDLGLWRSWTEFGKSYAFGDERVVEYLSSVSSRILSSPEARTYADAATFGFFCREGNIRRYLKKFSDLNSMRGIGTVTHIAPGNIPVNFAYSLVMGLLSGNSNILRMPTREFDQANFLVRVLIEVSNEPNHSEISDRSILFRSSRDNPSLIELVGESDGLIVWGGDETVGHFRSMARKPTSRELMFPSRLSTAILSSSAINSLSKIELDKLALAFYHDTYLVDQNACSSPSQVIWLGDEDSFKSASSKFWQSVDLQVKNHYATWSTTGVEKLLDVFRKVQDAGRVIEVQRASSVVWRSRDAKFRAEPLRYGAFAELVFPSLPKDSEVLRANEQTLTYFGVEKDDIFRWLEELQSSNVERIVPVGKALDIGLNWDGKETLVILSRRIELS